MALIDPNETLNQLDGEELVRIPSWITTNPVYNGMKIIEHIGRGAFSNVYKVKHLDGNVYAMKIMPIEKDRENLEPGHGFLRMLSEIRILRSLSPHPALLKYVFSWSDTVKPWFYIITELCECTLETFIKCDKRSEQLATTDAIHINKYRVCLDIIHGLKHLHMNGYIHCDVKPSNILIRADGRSVIGDVGISSMIGETIGYDYQSELYTDPRFIGDSITPVDPEMDVYSFGIVLFEMFYPFGETEMERVQTIMNLRQNNTISTSWWEECTSIAELVLCCTSQIVSSRPTIAALWWRFITISLFEDIL